MADLTTSQHDLAPAIVYPDPGEGLWDTWLRAQRIAPRDRCTLIYIR